MQVVCDSDEDLRGEKKAGGTKPSLNRHGKRDKECSNMHMHMQCDGSRGADLDETVVAAEVTVQVDAAAGRAARSVPRAARRGSSESPDET